MCSEFTTAVYRIVGDVQQFRVKVNLQKLGTRNPLKETKTKFFELESNSEDNNAASIKSKIASAVIGWEDDKAKQQREPEYEDGMPWIYLQSNKEKESKDLLTTSTKENQKWLRQCNERKKNKLRIGVSKTIVIAFARDDHKDLAQIRLYSNGSLEMTPGFMYGATKYQTQSNKGVRYNYWFEDASLCRKDLSLSSAKTTTFKNSLFLPIIGDMSNELLKVLFMCEIQSISGFSGRKRLHVEYRILYDTEIWNCKGVHPLQISSSSEGATQSQKPKTRNMLLFWKEKMCYFAHPVEALLETDEDPGVTRWPSLLFKVCSSDLRGNEVCKGYAWISLHDICPGNKETTLKTWKPQSTGFKKVIQLFKGGTTELNSIENVGIPMCPGSVLIKYGLQTTSSGSIQIRTNCFVQNNDKELQTHPQKQNVVLPFKDPGLISVLRRAKFRLEQSGEGQRLPPDLLETKTEKSVHCPVITKQPDGDLRVKEGHSFVIEVQAKGTEVLHYQWYKDSEKISSNAQSPIYKVHNSCKKDRGIYTCKVSNKGGACQSAPCTVHIMTKRNTTTQGL